MRKYSMPKVVYVLLISILLCLSINYTYAYFSSSKDVSSVITLNSIDVTWRNENANMALLPTLFDDPETEDLNEALSIQIVSELKRGDYVQLQAKDINDVTQDIKLNISNFGTTGAYCRIKLTGKYTTKLGEKKDCPDTWLNLALGGDNDTKTLMTNSGWFYSTGSSDGVGYYYYGSSLSSLTELSKNSGITLADYIFLSAESNTDMYGASLTITLTLEAVQSSNNAYKSVWGIA